MQIDIWELFWNALLRSDCLILFQYFYFMIVNIPDMIIGEKVKHYF